ncbi:MAG: translation initiation factor IF-2 subunit gamma [Candidatus Woesearchaeota archaeon]
MREETLKTVQPELNVGLVGHVDHGKTTLTKALSGKWTASHSEEIKRGITIRLGYADVSIWKCASCPEPEAYTLNPTCPSCGKEAILVRKLSLVDAPGHESLMATMLCGANIMDGALLLIAANEPCPQPQTKEHIMALQIIGVKNIVVVQNKIDLVSEEQAIKNYNQIKEFLKNTTYANAPIIPLSALYSINIDALLQAMLEQFLPPQRELTKPPIMFVARSFDVNKPGTKPEEMVGGVLGGALRQGVLKVGDSIELLPGHEVVEKNQKVWKPLTTRVIGLMTGGQKVDEVRPGGTFAVLTELDPSIVYADKLVGAVVGTPGTLPKVWSSLKLELHLLERVVGAKDELVVEPIKPNEFLMLNVNSAATVGVVKELKKNELFCVLKRPICAEPGSRATISRNVGQRWRLIGYGIIR